MPDLPSSEKDLTTAAILIVEDDIDIGMLLVHVLREDTDYHVMLAKDSFEALKIVRSIKPQFFLLDHQLPGMSGLELYDQLQNREEFKMMPVLFMSANPPIKLLEQRQIPYIQKPFELDHLLKTVKELLAE